MSLGLNLFVWRHETQYRARVFHKRINNLIPLKKYALLFLCIESEILFSFYRTYIMHIKRQNYPDSMYLMWWWHGRGTWFLVTAFLFWKYYRKNSQFLKFCHILGVSIKPEEMLEKYIVLAYWAISSKYVCHTWVSEFNKKDLSEI